MHNPGAPSSHVRTIRDEHGRAWTVRERVGDLYDRRGRVSLVFDARETMRRLWSYPANWHELSDEELLALSLAPVPQRP